MIPTPVPVGDDGAVAVTGEPNVVVNALSL